MLRVAQLARAPDCGSGGRRFKPAHAPHGTLAQLVERQTEDLRVSGSIPEGPTIQKAAGIHGLEILESLVLL